MAISLAVRSDTPPPRGPSFSEPYGRAATLFVHPGEAKNLRPRGIYARVVQDGRITAGDRVVKVA